MTGVLQQVACTPCLLDCFTQKNAYCPVGIHLGSVGISVMFGELHMAAHMMVFRMLPVLLSDCAGDRLQHDAMLFGLLTDPMCAGAVAKGPKLDDIQPAEAAGSGRTAAPLPAAASAASALGNQAAPRRVVQEADSGKARFVCCGFGGRKAGSKANSKR